MLTATNFKEIYYSIKDHNTNTQIEILHDFINTKFPEAYKMFVKFDWTALIEFIKNTEYDIYEDGKEIFEKDVECNYYYFILFGIE